jgi:hypothetical protein
MKKGTFFVSLLCVSISFIPVLSIEIGNTQVIMDAFGTSASAAVTTGCKGAIVTEYA